jgi:two-component system cell cycle sensor histidine kinase/response regulator CckA
MGTEMSTDSRGFTLLVVDDDAAVRRVAGKALRRAGYRVIEADGGEQALEIGRRRAGEIDLLVTDVVMPGMNGRELSERLKKVDPGLPVLFMSAYTEDEIFLQNVRVTQLNFIPKPFTLDELTGSVNEVLRRSEGAARQPDPAAGPKSLVEPRGEPLYGAVPVSSPRARER